jgi:hypothetical protein
VKHKSKQKKNIARGLTGRKKSSLKYCAKESLTGSPNDFSPVNQTTYTGKIPKYSKNSDNPTKFF